jgi:hypothetical protein
MKSKFDRQVQAFLDMSVPHAVLRWTALVVLFVFLYIRIWAIQGFFIVGYSLGIYFLNLLIAFLSPRVDPGLQEDDGGNGPTLPQSTEDEFRPFVRRLPEFRFWKKGIRATLMGLLATLFSFLDIPVFWPILLLYFCIMFFVTMKRQISHMITHKYIPFSWGKKKYKNKRTIISKGLNKVHSNRPANVNGRFTARPVLRPPARGKRLD